MQSNKPLSDILIAGITKRAINDMVIKGESSLHPKSAAVFCFLKNWNNFFQKRVAFSREMLYNYNQAVQRNCASCNLLICYFILIRLERRKNANNYDEKYRTRRACRFWKNNFM